MIILRFNYGNTVGSCGPLRPAPSLLRQVGTVHKRRRGRQRGHRCGHRAPLGVRPPLRLRRRALRRALRRMQRRAERVRATRTARTTRAARATGWDRRAAGYCLRRARL
eukprot:scaffold13061_cov62-Phaeocystis_antarctica.AAC.2